MEGLPFLGVCALASLGFAVGTYWTLSVLFAILSGYIVFFFRNPERLPPVGGRLVAAPADGRVIFVGQASDEEFGGGLMQKVSVFMSLWDVHINRVPIDGTVRDMKYRHGRFMAAFEERAGEENERNAILIESSKGQRVVMVQVAGLIARRIVCYPSVGVFVLKGQRIGLIRFGSRCDLYVPRDSKVLVQVGEKVLGGETVVAELPQLQTEAHADA
jgi:phosphatidylserine decarboxylase